MNMKKNSVAMKATTILNALSWVAVICGAIGKMIFPVLASWVFLVSAVVLAVTQFLLRVRDGNPVIRRLVFQQQIGGLVLVSAGVLMFTHVRNEWIVAMFIGTLLLLYTSFRIPQELDKLNK